MGDMKSERYQPFIHFLYFKVHDLNPLLKFIIYGLLLKIQSLNSIFLILHFNICVIFSLMPIGNINS